MPSSTTWSLLSAFDRVEQDLARSAGDLLILDDFLLRPLDGMETQDVYEIVVERHLKASTLVTSNREPSEWLAVMADPMLAQSAVDWLQSASYELVVEGDSYRRRQKPSRKQDDRQSSIV